MKKSLLIPLIALAVVVTVAFGALTMIITFRSFEREDIMWSYLEPYETAALDYLRQNKEFIALYGEDVIPDSRNISYGYTDPKKYTRISLNPQIPASAEEFEAELDHLMVSFELPDLSVVSVNFAKTPEGGLEITGWEIVDE